MTSVKEEQKNLDCTRLLSFVEEQEAQLSSVSTAFGHPPPPKLYGTETECDRVCLAQTQRTVAAMRNEESPFLVWALNEQTQNESISTLTLFSHDGIIVVLIGTNQGRVLSIHLQENKVDEAWQPLPGLIETTTEHEHTHHNTDLHRSSSQHSLSTEHNNNNNNNNKADEYPFPFCPRGGVTSITRHNPLRFEPRRQEQEDSIPWCVWVTYADGQCFRLPQSCLLTKTYPETVPPPKKKRRPQDVDYNHVIRARVLCREPIDMNVVPCPMRQASPLALLPNDPQQNLVAASDEDEDEEEEDYNQEDEIQNNESCSMLVFFSAGTSAPVGLGDPPTLALYTSEDLFVGRIAGGEEDDAFQARRRSSASLHASPRQRDARDSELLNVAIGASAALVRGVVGVVKWGFLGSPTAPIVEDPMEHDESESTHHMLVEFEELHYLPPLPLFAGYEWHDAPRQIQSVVVHDCLAATTDTLGRVSLIDLTTFQVVRLWKGVREASVCFLQSSNKTYLAIHSPLRRTVEVWKLRHGPRVKLYQVGRDAQLVSSTNANGELSCYVLHTSTPGSVPCSLELIVPEGPQPLATLASAPAVNAAPAALLPTSPAAVASTLPTTSLIQESTMRLQTLQQMLDNTNIPCQKQHVLETLKRIHVLTDLASALDIISVSVAFEERMGVKGAAFHAAALEHCQSVLDKTTENKGPDVTQSPPVVLLKDRIQYHQQLVNAYKALNTFEIGLFANGDDLDPEEEALRSTPRSVWAVEATSWVKTYQTIHGRHTLSGDDDGRQDNNNRILRFADFVKCCARASETKTRFTVHNEERFCIYLSDSSKTRREIISHVFRPLMRDIFSFQVTNVILDNLGLLHDADYVLTCFGEWFMTLPAREAAHKAFFALHSPIVRWLQESVNRQVEQAIEKYDSFSSQTALLALHKFCADSPDLPRAFLLATTSRDAVSSTMKKLEVKTYGKVWKSEAVQPWEEVLRKLRVCLFVSLRLQKIPMGAFPITINHVESPDIFSVYKWVAHDELLFTNKQEEIVALEQACTGSSLVFDPSSPAGDHPSRWKLLQKACLGAAITDEERAEYLVDLEDEDSMQGALLLYLSHHNNPSLLVAHRALILAENWLEEPHSVQLLQDCVDALAAMKDGGDGGDGIVSFPCLLAAAARLEVWQTCIRPTFRALFFGFDEVHELSEETFVVLYGDVSWLQSIGKIALNILALLSKFDWMAISNTLMDAQDKKDSSSANVGDEIMNHGDNKGTSSFSWPEVRQDFILQRLTEKLTRPVRKSMLDTHRVIVCGSLLSDDYETLSHCVDGFYEAFDGHSLFAFGENTGDRRQQMAFLEQCIISHAETLDPSTWSMMTMLNPNNNNNKSVKAMEDNSLERIILGDIETLALLWNTDVGEVRTVFLLAMYELGKDTMVDEFWWSPSFHGNSSKKNIHAKRFLEDGLGVACRRLSFMLHTKRSSKVRSVWGLLDADTTEWIRDESERSSSLLDNEKEGRRRKRSRQALSVPVSQTHVLVMRLMGVCNDPQVSKETRMRVHALSILTGTLQKELGG